MEQSDIKIDNSVKGNLGWGPAAAIFVSIGAYIFSQLVIVIPIVLIKASHTSGSDNFINYIDNSSWASLLLTGFSALGLLVFLYVFLKLRKRSFKNLGFSKIKFSQLGWLLLALVGYVICLTIAMTIASKIPGFDSNQKQDVGFTTAAGWQLALAFIGLVVIPPFAEEIVFRGFLYRGLASKWPKILSALITSLIFALLHFQWNVSVDVFVLSLTLIILYEKTHNLWMCVFLHGIKNFIAFATIFLFATH
jgi:uncharacterized protein